MTVEKVTAKTHGSKLVDLILRKSRQRLQPEHPRLVEFVLRVLALEPYSPPPVVILPSALREPGSRPDPVEQVVVRLRDARDERGVERGQQIGLEGEDRSKVSCATTVEQFLRARRLSVWREVGRARQKTNTDRFPCLQGFQLVSKATVANLGRPAKQAVDQTQAQVDDLHIARGKSSDDNLEEVRLSLYLFPDGGEARPRLRYRRRRGRARRVDGGGIGEREGRGKERKSAEKSGGRPRDVDEGLGG